jgi:hypothetical protein
MSESAALPQIQSFLVAVIQRAAFVGDDATLRGQTEHLVGPNPRLSPGEQLDIYRQQFWLRHIGALKEDFVSAHHLLGDESFRILCERYLAAHPPTSFTLRDLGDRFGDFLEATEPYKSDSLLLDCARLEWAFVEAFDAPNAPPLDPRAIATAPEEAWERARIVLHPSVQRLLLAHPAHVYRARVHEGEDPPRPDRSPTGVVVYRGPEKLMYVAIELLALELLDLLAAGAPLGAACERVARRAGITEALELAPRVGAWFQSWAAYGWVSRVDF